MPARTRECLANPEHVVVVATSLPTNIVDILNARTRKKYQPRAHYLRDAIIAQMTRDGLLAGERA